MVGASARAAAGVQVSPMWLVLTYLLHTIGELALSPVGLSTVTKLAPQRMVGQMMGVWFMSISLGNLMAGQVAGQFETLPLPAALRRRHRHHRRRGDPARAPQPAGAAADGRGALVTGTPGCAPS
jgi:dipeptide/tripeptide permease